MLELNKWFFVQLINFLVLLVLLNYILFKPFLRLLTRREEHVKGSLNSAKAMDKEKEARLQEIERKLAETRNKAKTIFDELNRQGLTIQKEAITISQREAAELTRKAGETLEAEVKKIKESLRGKVETFSKMIVEKMIGI